MKQIILTHPDTEQPIKLGAIGMARYSALIAGLYTSLAREIPENPNNPGNIGNLEMALEDYVEVKSDTLLEDFIGAGYPVEKVIIEPDAPVKRGPGRPRKNPLPVIVIPANETEAEDLEGEGEIVETEELHRLLALDAECARDLAIG